MTKSDWISVDDRLPEAWESVLICWLGIDMLVGYLDVIGEWHNKNSAQIRGGITHWQPLPEPPEEKHE